MVRRKAEPGRLGKKMRIDGWTHPEIAHYVQGNYPELVDILTVARVAVPICKREIWPHEAGLLYALARPLNQPGAKALEIGTALGYSAAILAQALSDGELATLNPKLAEYGRAVEHLAGFPNVRVYQMTSEQYWQVYGGGPLDLVFVDGSHVKEDVELDCRWFNQLRPGGLILFHDYSPAEAARPTPDVFEVVSDFGRTLGRDPDVLVSDSQQVGMAGWYRRGGEAWPIMLLRPN